MAVITVSFVDHNTDAAFVRRVVNGVLGATAVTDISFAGPFARAVIPRWPQTPMGKWARTRLEGGREVRVVYDPPLFWRCRLRT